MVTAAVTAGRAGCNARVMTRARWRLRVERTRGEITLTAAGTRSAETRKELFPAERSQRLRKPQQPVIRVMRARRFTINHLIALAGEHSTQHAIGGQHAAALPQPRVQIEADRLARS